MHLLSDTNTDFWIGFEYDSTAGNYTSLYDGSLVPAFVNWSSGHPDMQAGYAAQLLFVGGVIEIKSKDSTHVDDFMCAIY